MENNKDAKTAFPTLFYNNQSGQPCGHDSGMTLRDYFANSAMQALIQKIELSQDQLLYSDEIHSFVPVLSYQIADEMLKQREL